MHLIRRSLPAYLFSFRTIPVPHHPRQNQIKIQLTRLYGPFRIAQNCISLTLISKTWRSARCDQFWNASVSAEVSSPKASSVTSGVFNLLNCLKNHFVSVNILSLARQIWGLYSVHCTIASFVDVHREPQKRIQSSWSVDISVSYVRNSRLFNNHAFIHI